MGFHDGVVAVEKWAMAGSPAAEAEAEASGRSHPAICDVGALVIGAADGDRRAWAQLVLAYSELVSAITTAHRLSESDSARVRATVWRRLDRSLGKIRQPDRIGAWLGAVTRDECVRALTTAAARAA